MANLLMSGIVPSLAGNNSAAVGAGAAPAGASGRAALTRTPSPAQATAPMARAKPGDDSDLPSTSPGNGPANTGAPGGGPASEAIGTQLVLVFDDQTHSMTVKILDIETQKVQQQTSPDMTSTTVARAPSRQATSGTLVDTKA